MAHLPISVQLYTVRNLTAEDFRDDEKDRGDWLQKRRDGRLWKSQNGCPRRRRLSMMQA